MSTRTASVLHPEAVAPEARERGGDRTVAALFAVTGLALFAVMGILGLLMRLKQATILDISPEWFYRLMTLHGAGMLVGALMAMMGALWFVLRADVALSVPRMLAAYAAMLLGAVGVLVAVMFGGFAAGWAFLWPLPFSPVGQWGTWATTVFLVGFLLVGVGFMVFCLDVLEQVTRAYGGLVRTLGLPFLMGRDDDPPPPQAIAGAVVSIAGLIASAVGTTVVVALIIRTFDTGVRIDALWAKNLTYFFGHTVANLIIYLAAGAIYVLLPRYTGRPWRTTVPIVVAWLCTLLLVMTAYSHHLYMDVVQPRVLEYIASTASFAAAIPVAVVTIYTGMMLVWGSSYRWTLASRLLYLGFAGWAIGGVGAVIDSVVPVNARFHNTLWVPAHFHTYLLVGVMFWAFAFVAHLLECAAQRPAAPVAAWLAPGLMVVGGYGLVAMWYVSGALGIPRRYAVHPAGTSGYSVAASVFVVVFALGFLALVVEFARLTVIARRMAAVAVPEADDGRGRERAMLAWQDFRRRFGTVAAPVPEGPAVATARVGLWPEALLATPAQLAGAAAAAVVSLASFIPAITRASEDDPRYHHVVHAGQFLVGALVGVVIASLPAVFPLLRFRGSGGVAVTLVVAAPAGMLLAMAPAAYGPLDAHPLLHALYHVGIAALGLLTGLGCARLGRTTGWLVLVASVGMALLFAPGVSGG